MLLVLTTTVLKALPGHSAIPTGLLCYILKWQTSFTLQLLMGLNGSTSKEMDCSTHSWLFTFFTDVSFLQDFYVYCNLFHVDKNISGCLYVGAMHIPFSDSQKQGSELKIKSYSSTEAIKLVFQTIKWNRYQGLNAWLIPTAYLLSTGAKHLHK